MALYLHDSEQILFAVLNQLDNAWHVHAVPISGASSQQVAAEISRHPNDDDASPSFAERTSVRLTQPGGGDGTRSSMATSLASGTGLMLGLTTMAALVIMMSFWVIPKPQGSNQLLSGLNPQVRCFLFRRSTWPFVFMGFSGNSLTAHCLVFPYHPVEYSGTDEIACMQTA